MKLNYEFGFLAKDCPLVSRGVAGTYQAVATCRESAARNTKNGEVWYNTARMSKGKQI